MFSRLASSFLGFIALSALSSTAFAEGLEKNDEPATDGVHPLILAGYSDGLAAGVEFGMGDFALRGSAGYMPLIFSITNADDLGFERFEFRNSAQANADVLFLPWARGSGNRVGLSLGYRYNTLLTHGFALGGQVEATLSDDLTLLVMFNLAFYPDGSYRVSD
jgi:hypothetical protein